MSIEKMNKYKSEKKQKGAGSSRYDDEHRIFKRDTAIAICVLLVLFLAPVGITLYENHKAAVEAQQLQDMISEYLASSSEATAAGDTGETAAAESAAAAGSPEANASENTGGDAAPDDAGEASGADQDALAAASDDADGASKAASAE